MNEVEVVNKIAQQIIKEFCDTVSLANILYTFKKLFRENPNCLQQEYTIMILYEYSYEYLSGYSPDDYPNFSFDIALNDNNRHLNMLDYIIKDGVGSDVSEEVSCIGMSLPSLRIP